MKCFFLTAQPYLTSAPTGYASSTDPTQVIIYWDQWSSGQGDGPVEQYEVHYRYKNDSMDNTSYPFLTATSSASTSLVVDGLDVDTEYDFAIVVVRSGEGGAGLPSHKTTVRTQCASKNIYKHVHVWI